MIETIINISTFIIQNIIIVILVPVVIHILNKLFDDWWDNRHNKKEK